MLLTNRFNSLYREYKKTLNQVLLEDVDTVASVEKVEATIQVDVNKFSPFEKQIYEFCFLGKHSIEEATKEFKTSRKVVYNAIGRIKKKVSKMNPNK